jgi:hypothetical protein
MASSKVLTFSLAGIVAVSLLISVQGAGAQQNDAAQNKSDSSAAAACSKFKDSIRPAAPPVNPTSPDNAGKGFGAIAESGQFGIACAQALAKYFEQLRSTGAQVGWSDIEKDIDQVIDTYRQLVEMIEGTNGVYEQGRLAVSALSDQIKDLSTRRTPDYPPLVSAQKIRDGLGAGLEATKKLKNELDRSLVDMQERKSEIAEAQGVQRFFLAQQSLENLNAGLTKVIEELVKAVKKPGS